MTVPVEVQDIADNPGENLGQELKEWVDLSGSKVARAKIARHLAALANYGGGYIVFGFKDNGSLASHASVDLTQYEHDAISGIIERYLIPTFECDFFEVTRATDGNQISVVRVPSHGHVPICAKRSGPSDKRGNPQGIRAGTYYIRSPGPKSEPIESPSQWHDLIHRCVINERERLLQSLGKILGQPLSAIEPTEDLLKNWHGQMGKLYLEKFNNG